MKKLLAICFLIALGVACSSDENNEENNPSPSVFDLITITTNESVQFKLDTATMGGVLSVAIDAVNKEGYVFGTCCSLTPDPVIDNIASQPAMVLEPTTGVYYAKLESLEPGKTYYARTYITDGEHVKYGNQITFTVPKLFDSTYIYSITSTDFMVQPSTAYAYVSNSEITAMGCCYGTDVNPTTDDLVTNNTQSGGYWQNFFECNSPGLIPGQVYHARVFIVVSGKTFYGVDTILRMAGYPGPSGGTVVFDFGRRVSLMHDLSVSFRYIEAAPATIDNNGSSDYVWGTPGVSIGTSFTHLSPGIGKGGNNTILIHNRPPANSAANLCYNAVIGGNSDWYLPTVEELRLIHKAQIAGVVNFNQTCWASEEVEAYTAYTFSFSAGIPVYVGKGQQGPSPAILPIRYF